MDRNSTASSVPFGAPVAITERNRESSRRVLTAAPAPPVQLPGPRQKNVTVEVAGSRFCILPSLFQHIENLKWKKNGEVLRLNTNPDVFEMVLQFFLFGSLPDPSALSFRRATELLDLIAPLESQSIEKLKLHAQGYLAENKSGVFPSSSMFRKRLPSISSLSSRNKASTSVTAGQKAVGATSATFNNQSSSKITLEQKEAISIHGPDNATENAAPPHDPPPLHHVRVQRTSHSSKLSLSSFPTSVMRSDSSSSDGSISKLSQPSYFGGVQTLDENGNSTMPFDSTDLFVVPRVPAFAITDPNNNSNMALPDHFSSYPLQVGEFQEAAEFIAEASTATKPFSENFSNAKTPLQNASSVKAKKPTSNKVDQNANGGAKKKKSIFRNVFRGNNGNKSHRKMTHSDWCASEYVL